MNRRRKTVAGGAVAAVVVLVAALGYSIAYANSETTVTATVTSKERVCDSSSNGTSTCRYLVFTDAGTFEVTDGVIVGRFNSSDIYGHIRVDQRYKLTVVGFRVGFLSMYQNIKQAEELPDEQR